MTSAYASSILRKTLCHASRSKKPQNQTQRADFPKNGNIQKPKPLSFMLLLFALLCGWPAAWGQTEPDEWDGSASGTFFVTRDYSRNSDCDIAKGTSLTLNVTGNNLTLQVARFKLEDGDASTAGGELNINITGNNVTFDFVQILINGIANINNGAKVSIINNGTNFKITKRAGNVTALSNGYIPLFRVHPYGSLEIKGISEDKKVTIDGGWTMDDKGIPTNEPGFQFGFGVLYTTNGKVTFENILIRNFVSYLRGYNATTNQGEGCLLRFNGGSPSTEGKHSFKNVEITKCYAGPTNLELNNGYSYGRIIGMYSGIHDITFEKVHIHHCFVHEPENSNAGIFGMGGIIRSQGSMGGTLMMKNCTINDNRYMNRRYFMSSPPAGVTDSLAGQGGAINWRSGLLDDDYPQHKAKIIIENSKFYNNMAKQGGAIATNGALDLSTNVEIYNNFAAQGGGVYFWTYNGMQDTYDGRGFDAIFGSGVNIHHNEAKEYGGGSYVGIEASNDVGFKAILSGTWNPATDTVNPLFRVKINTGATIQNNKAPKGAGIAIRDAAPYRHKNTQEKLTGNSSVDNPAYNEWSGIYERQVIVAGGTVCNNTAQRTAGTEMAGAGIYIEKYPYPSDHAFYPDYGYSDEDGGPDVYGAGTLTVNAESGLIYGNTAINSSTTGLGGGMYIASNFTDNTIVSTLNVNIGKAGKDLQIYNNQAYTDGGGVYVLYDRTDGRKNQGTVTVKNGIIGKTDLATGNKALNGNGGGICVLGGTVHVEGGNVEYNTANQLGGGVYVKVPNVESNTIIRGGANISRNTAKGGGGVYVDQGTLQVIGDTWNSGAGAWQLLPWATGTYNPAAEATHTRITNNTATDGNGGGINAGHGEVDLTNTLIYNNTASGTGENKGRGGGVYLNDGTINLTTSKILFNTAALNGGGIDDHLGNISITGGEISDNTAINGGGGGVYTHDGDITVWPDYDIENTAITSQQIETVVMPKGTKVDSNKAGKNGGGLNTHKGRFDVRFATITNNKAGMSFGSDGNGGGTGGNGGGLFCEGPHTDPSGYTVRLLHCHLNDNKAFGNSNNDNDLTGRGGGIYLKFGSIFAEHCDILRNEADINGGGLDNHEGELRVYGSYIDHNEAKTGKGGGIYTEEGNIVVGPCDSYGYTSSKASRIYNNTAYINGGGINNHHGDITIHGDRINNNTAVTGDGGGVYINSGKINMYGGQINNNKADNGKGGGVYGGSGKFNIMEREPHPILEILEVENITTDSFTVHFHHVDRGLAMESGATNKEFGIAYSTYEYPDLPENQEWTTTNWPGVTKITFTVADGESDEITTTHPEGKYTYVRNEGCSRVIVYQGLSAGTTYYVVAYGKYRKGDKNYFDASPALKVVIPSSGKAAEGNHPKSIYPAVDENPFFMELTPLQQAMLANTPVGDTTAAPAPRAITDSDDPNQEKPVDIPQINGNTAMFGGGICIDKKGAELIFAGSTKPDNDNTSNANKKKIIAQINYNYASEAGGGIYIGRESAENYAQMKMMGKCQVNYNHVPADKLGGGIYLDGRLYVGDKSTDNPVYNAVGNPNPVIHGLRVDRNFASSKTHAQWLEILPDTLSTSNPNYANSWSNTSLMPDNSKLNNVFLTRYDYDYYVNIDEGHPGDNNISVITLLSDISGKNASDNDKPYSHIGFSVLKGFCPVIATASSFGGDYLTVQTTTTNVDEHERWLYELMVLAGGSGNTAQTMTGAVFEDSESYVAVHTRQNMPPFLGKFIYLWGCWTHPIVKTDPETDNPMGKLHKYGTTDAESNFKGHYKIRNSFTEEGNPGYTATSKTPLVWEIYSPEGLAWFTSYVNGLNVFDEVEGGKMYDPSTGTYTTANDPYHFKWNKEQNPYAEAYIMNDLDMSAYLWVPIGSVQKFYISNLTATGDDASLFVDSEKGVPRPSTLPSTDPWYSNKEHYYRGKFDGQGHIIKGVQGLYLTGIRKFGLFGYLNGAEVKNTFIDDGLFVSDGDTITYSAGGIAGEIKAGSLSNSEARMNFNATHSGDNTKVGGLVGYLKGGNIHSCMAMPSITGTSKYMGGLVGKMDAGTTLKNSFANVEFLTSPAYNVGGIAGENNGLIENVYVRYQGTTPPEGFGWFAGKNNYTAAGETTPAAIGTIRYCYAPRVADDESYDYADFNYIANPIENSVLELQANYGATKLESGKYGFKHRDQQMTENADNGYIVNDVFLGGLLPTLNNWVAANAGYTTWTRTMASPINDDYPVLQIADFNVVGSEDGIYMKYDDNVNDMWKEPNYNSLDPVERAGKNFKSLTAAANPNAAMYLYNTNPTAVNVSENEAVRLYIHENVGITQTDGAELHARVGVTFDNSDGTTANGGAPYDWHMFSSALQSAPMGLKYYDDIENYPIQSGYESLSGTPTADNGITEDDYKSRLYMDPPPTSWYQSDDPSSGLNNYDANKIGYFPTNTPYGSSAYGGSAGAQATFNDSFDFYCFSEQHRHWINFKRQGRPASQGVEKFFDHWYQDANDLNGQLDEGKHYNIEYPNESTFQVGKGYMMGVSAVSMLMADGTLNNGDGITTPITNNEYSINPSPYAEELRGTNLVGNPFQSYLDFDKLANDQANNGIIHNKSYYLFDADAGRYICYPATASDNQINAPQFIHPHQGFFVKTANGGNLTFKNSMRSATGGQGSTFRGDNFNYPLVNLFCYDAEGHYDVTTVEMNRPELGGGSKLKDKRNGNSLIYARLEDEDYQTLFAPTGTSTVPVRFEPSQDGVYTMRWGTLHGDFHYLHLVDNMSGADVDMLRSEEYRFEATTSDYISRFKLVFEVTDVEENHIEAEATTFAFCMGDEIIVNGTGYLEVFDVQGRRLSAKRLVDAQSSVSLPNVAAGIYFLRLSDDKQVRTQKMVINY